MPDMRASRTFGERRADTRRTGAAHPKARNPRTLR
ncbi:hypothetical protein BPC006_I1197 [Burkholderia pseudomallei BPC006]|nr:hypothetical protein BPC006_I1197 [Burkholderia pseudomallei BPC006]